MTILIPVAIIGLLVLANGLFVAAEFAIVGAPRARIENQAAQGSVLAKRVRRILDDPRRQDRYIATTQIGISVASLGLGMYGETLLADHLVVLLAPLDGTGWVSAHAVASVMAVALLTCLHIVLGEMVPKALALQRADRTVLYVSPVIELLGRILLPLVATLNAVGNGVLRLCGVARTTTEPDRYHSPGELQFVIEESREGGLLRGESGHILRELLKFGDISAGDVFVPRVQLIGVAVGTTAEELRTIVRTHPHTRYPVHTGDMDHVIGSVHIKDVLRHMVSGEPIAAGDARPLLSVPTTAPLDEVLATMGRARAQMAVVMDEHGGTAGLLTIDDLFEEIVGEIEGGRGRAPIVREADGRLAVYGTVSLADAGAALGVSLAHPDVRSVSGLVLALLGRPAAVGDTVVWKQARIEVSAVSGRGVQRALIGSVPRDPSRR